MKVLICDRTAIYHILHACFQSISIKPVVAELGVLKGENAQMIDEVLSPSSLYLIDAWSPEAFVDYKNNNLHRTWVDDVEKFEYYFGGSLFEYETFDKLFEMVIDRFSDKDHVNIIRDNTFNAYRYLSENITSPFDLIYIDASHQYETVLDDLMLYKDLLSYDGFLQLNDCCHSALGVKQNLGVLEAVVKFTKITDFIAIAITNTDWSDVLLVRRNSQIAVLFDQVVNNNEISYVEVPNQLLGAMHVKSGKRSNITFI